MFLIVAALAGCGPGSIEDLCAEAAMAQCDLCYSCEIDGEQNGATLCRLGEGTDQEGCRTQLIETCVDQSATVEQPKNRLLECADSFQNLTCEDLVSSYAQAGPITTEECAYYL